MSVGTVVMAQMGWGEAAVGMQAVAKLEQTSRWGRAHEGLWSRWHTMR